MNRLRLLFALPLTLLTSACLGDLVEFFCMMDASDPDHCYQAAAVQSSDPEDCDNVKGAGFSGSNPPKDKCYLQIAGNTGDPSVCASVQGGFMSYSEEECVRNAMQGHSVEDCKDAADELRCRSAWASYGKDCGEGFVAQQGACVPKPPPEDVPGKGADDDIESKAEADLNTIKDAATGKYMELLTQAIDDEEDDTKKLGLEKYKEFLEKSGEALDTVATTADQLKELKRIFLDAYDPAMSVENMRVDKILEPGLFDRVSGRIFGEDPPTERSKAEDALSVYEVMLKRQGDNDFLQQGRLDRIKDVVTSKVKDDLTGQVKDKITAVAEGVAGTAFATVGIVDHALSSFQEAAQKEMFIGLAASYNRQRDAIAASNPGLDPEEIHRRTVASVRNDPYQDVPNAGFVKFGNILENGDCKDAGDNPLCIDNRVFWTAMDKTYRHTRK